MRLPDFNDVKARNAFLIANKSRILRHKKGSFKHSDGAEMARGAVHKGIKAGANQLKAPRVSDAEGEFTTTVVGNTYNWLDSHGDVHAKGVFKKSIKESGQYVVHLRDHVQQLDAEVGVAQKLYEAELDWSGLGVDKEGTTESLLMDTKVLREYDPKTFEKYLNGRIKQHSVGMQYVKVSLGVNDPEYKEEFATFSSVMDTVGNPDELEELGFVYLVHEAKLIEISAVIRGSNILTGTIEQEDDEDADKVFEALENKNDAELKNILQLCNQELTKRNEPSDHSDEPPKGTHKSAESEFLGY